MKVMQIVRRSGALLIGALIATSASFAATFYNGSFELGASISGQFATLSPGNNTSITGWTVLGSGNGSGVDYISTYWNPAEGLRSVDLSATTAGGIAQTFDTVAGTLYSVSYAISGNPVQGMIFPKAYLVQVDGVTVSSLSYTFQDTNSLTNMNWETRSFEFTATGAATTLAFLSSVNSPCGPALDNVTVMAIPEPSTYAMILGAMTLGLMGWRRFRK